MAITTKSPWDEKFLREQPFMAFGSMMNAFGRVNEGKRDKDGNVVGMSLVEFEIAAKKIFEMAQQFAVDSFKSVSHEAGVDIPMKK